MVGNRLQRRIQRLPLPKVRHIALGSDPRTNKGTRDAVF